jgi:hypothetical protein
VPKNDEDNASINTSNSAVKAMSQSGVTQSVSEYISICNTNSKNNNNNNKPPTSFQAGVVNETNLTAKLSKLKPASNQRLESIARGSSCTRISDSESKSMKSLFLGQNQTGKSSINAEEL